MIDIADLFTLLFYPGIAFMLALSFIYGGILRKLASRMQSRIGPPILQPFYDFLKLLQKEDIRPEAAGAGFDLWPAVAIGSVLLSGLLVPVAGILPLGFSGDIILFIYFFSLGSIAIFLSGLASQNPFSSVGSSRGLIQLISYELPLIISLAVPALYYHSISLSSMAAGTAPLFMAFPFAFAAYFVAMLAGAELPPFHIPGAHQEIVAGPLTEYSGTKLAFLELAYLVKAFVLISLGVAVFLGGSGDVLAFLLKSLILLAVLAVFRAGFARLRIGQAFRLCWLFGALAVIDLIRVSML